MIIETIEQQQTIKCWQAVTTFNDTWACEIFLQNITWQLCKMNNIKNIQNQAS